MVKPGAANALNNGRMKSLATLVTGQRSRWLVIGLWVVLAVAATPLAMKLPDVTKDSVVDFIPADSQAREVGEILDERFEGGNQGSTVLTYERDGGLLPEDEAVILAQAAQAFQVELASPGFVPFGPQATPGLVSPDGDAALVVFPLDQAEQAEIRRSVESLREITGTAPEGLRAHVTGSAVLEIDNTIIREESDFTLFAVTAILVLTLLLAVYRSPVIALVPLVTVGLAYNVVAAILYLLAEAGMTVTGPSRQLLLVLMFGATTDYCLLLVARYVEDLRTSQHEADAMRSALPRVAASIIASASTTILALLTLVLASVGLVSSLGPVNAIGLAVGLLAALTLLPAMITVLGRRAFWPGASRVAYDPAYVPSDREGARWGRLGAAVMKRPAVSLAAVLLLFAVGAAGLTQFTTSANTRADIKGTTDGTDGFDIIARNFPPGILAPATVMVERTGGQVSETDVTEAQARLSTVADIGLITPPRAMARDASAVVFDVVFPDDPFGNDAIERVGEMREALDGLGGGARAIVGGAAGQVTDYRDGLDADFRIVIPLVLGVVMLVMIVLLRAIVAPLYILLSTVASFFSILGISVLLSKAFLDVEDFNSALPIFAFVFLVALGVDYNIFLMDRVREEAKHHGTRDGALRAMVATGPVITSAGLILAGTFAALLTVPTATMRVLGLTVALGVLLDTFVVRALFIPSMIALLGERNWWPSNPAGTPAGADAAPVPAGTPAAAQAAAAPAPPPPVAPPPAAPAPAPAPPPAPAPVAPAPQPAVPAAPPGPAPEPAPPVAPPPVPPPVPAAAAARATIGLSDPLGTGTPGDVGALVFDDDTTITLEGVHVLGREPEGDAQVAAGAAQPIPLDDPEGTISRVHAEVRVVSAGAVQLVDRGSTNGTRIWDDALGTWDRLVPGEPRTLRFGDRVSIGPRTFVYEPSRQAETPATRPGSATVALGQVTRLLASTDGALYPLDRDYVIGTDPLADDAVRQAKAAPIALRDDQQVARIHAYVTIDGLRVLVRDAATPSGTFVAPPGGSTWEPVGTELAELKPGWSVRVGSHVLTYRVDAGR